ncbi:hypothetical protein V8B55DRAFT_1460200, partial [Mucor lusitanicus]
METRQYKIIQASTQELLFIKCAKCKLRITFVTRNEFVYGQETCYCDKCKTIKTMNQDKKVTYKLGLAVLDIQTNKMESLALYDDEVARVFGCLPLPYLENLQQDKWLSKKIEELLVGLYCSALVSKADKKNVRKAKKVQFLYTDQLAIVDLIKATTDDITFDASVL